MCLVLSLTLWKNFHGCGGEVRMPQYTQAFKLLQTLVDRLDRTNDFEL